jgi:cytochrome c oxidase subunit 2
MGHLLGMPALASAHGAKLDQMMGWIHGMMIVLFIGWMAFFLYAVTRFRRSRNPVADYAGAKSHASTYHEIVVVALEAVFLLGFSIPIWAQRVRALPAERDSVVVHVTAEQFAWNVRYPGPDGVFGRTDMKLIDPVDNPIGLDRTDPAAVDDVVALNQLHLPVNKPAIIELTSKDVIHCFALQEMRIKQDVVPGMMTPAWFIPTVTTAQMRARKESPSYNYEISCAQLCGLGHYRMRGFLTIDDDEASFQAWLASQGSS